MNDFWMVGLTGAMVGGALGLPLLRRTRGTSDVTGVQRRMLGALFLLGAIAVAMIATEHGQLTSRRVALSLEHVEYAGDLLFWSVLVLLVRRAAGRQTAPMAVAAVVAAPLLLYAAYVLGAGQSPRFIWLLPASTIGAGYASALWLRTGSYRDAAPDARLVTRMIAFAVVLCVAQSVRTFWPHVDALREIVPITMTVGFLSIATLAMRALVDTRPVDGNGERHKPYARSALDETAAAKLLADLATAMERERWYSDTTLSLRSLAERLRTTPHALSQALNQVDGRGLNEYLAAYRVAEARRLLLDPASDRYTIDAVAESAGFGSRSAFYKAFKDIEGITPTAFRKRHRQP